MRLDLKNALGLAATHLLLMAALAVGLEKTLPPSRKS
jgi:hypothetical protein